MGCHWASSEAARRIIILFGGLDKVEIKKIKTMNGEDAHCLQDLRPNPQMTLALSILKHCCRG
jgi:hypothetical protein